MELRTGKKEKVMRIRRLRLSLRSVLKFWTLVLYSLVDMSPVTVCHTPLRKNSGVLSINPLKSNDAYMGRTAPLTSKRCILYIYSTNIGNEYFKHGIYSPFFSPFKMQFVS